MKNAKKSGGVLQHVTGENKDSISLFSDSAPIIAPFFSTVKRFLQFFRRFLRCPGAAVERQAIVEFLLQEAEQVERQGYTAAAWYLRRAAHLISIGAHLQEEGVG